ncbi:MAG: 4,5-DOPA dioxygenase extradiol [Bacteroidetes bacterium]|nr:4,5-DOPA dioxygenase extradiol [Bacteroidota bacterium]
MQRIHFIKLLASLPLTTTCMNLNALKPIFDFVTEENKMPVLFLGHGSPMNAIEDNEFVEGFKKIGKQLNTPKAIIVISAHWETKGTFVTAMEKPRTIHDFGGFPDELFKVQYPAPGSPQLAKSTKEIITKTVVSLDEQWGLDHGTWSVVKHLYPMANIPIIQLSIDYTKDAQYHYDLAKELSQLREKGVLIIGSGNMVHNLGLINWQKLSADNYAYDWTIEASSKMKEFILSDNHAALINYKQQGKAFDLSIPSPEHYLPLLYVLALKNKQDAVDLFNDKAVAGSLTMTSVKIG